MSPSVSSWYESLNKSSEGRYLMFTVCTNCSEEILVACKEYEVTKKGDPLSGLEMTIYYCPNCDVVFNFDEAQPKTKITWLTEEEAKEKGWTKEGN